MRHPRRACASRSEEGMALITAIMFMMVATALTTAAAAYAVHDLSTTGVDRKQVQSSGAAEAGIDLAIADLQSATPPCTGNSSLTGTLSSAPTTESYTVNIIYYNSSGTSLNSNCTGGTSSVLPATITPADAVITSTGTNAAGSLYGTRTMTAEVSMAAVSAPAITDAIFGNNGVSFSQTYNVYSQTGQSNNANVYSNAGWSCSQVGTINGNLFVQSAISDSQTCSVTGTAWAGGSVSSSHSGSTFGSIKSNSTAHPAVSLGSGQSVGSGGITAAGTINVNGASVSGNVVPNASVGAPPSQTFPTWDYTPSAWTGYTSLTASTCTALTADLTAMATAVTPTLISTSCKYNISGTFPINQDLAIFDTAGMAVSSPVTFKSTSSTSHAFYFIVPSTGLTVGSCNTNISASQTLTIGTASNPLTALLYTPCDIALSQTSEIYGQLYAGGTVAVSQSFALQYSPFTWPGATGTGGGTASYTVNILYEREQQ